MPLTDKQRLGMLRSAILTLKKTTKGYTPTGTHWKPAMNLLRDLERDLEGAPSRVPDLGPVTPGGKSVLRQDLTHMTGGLDKYPAFDDAFHAGKSVIAPEPLTVTRRSSARRRDGTPNGKAFYADGASGIKYWFGHTTDAPAVGTKFGKGDRMTFVSGNHEAPHLHVGVDARALIGKVLEHHTNYTHGAPTVGVQLAKALDV